MIDEITQQSKTRMEKSIEVLASGLSKLRTGRAHPSLIEHIMVSYYGNNTPLNQVANITVEDARTLSISPWEKNMVQPIEKAIMSSDLGLNPTTAGIVIRVPLPPLTEERRKELVKVVRDEAEKAKVAIRNIRRDANNEIKELLKAKEISEDDQHRAEADIQKMTDSFVTEIDKTLGEKETDLMEI